MALPNPKSEEKKFLLPYIFSLRDLYDQFCKHYIKAYGISEDNPKVLSWGKFWEYWNEQFPYLKKLSKKTDFCDLCCNLKTVLKDRYIKEEDKIKAQKKLSHHLEEAKAARNCYNEFRENSHQHEERALICFDFAESILLPLLLETPSTFYFKSKRKIDIFGICNIKKGTNRSI